MNTSSVRFTCALLLGALGFAACSDDPPPLNVLLVTLDTTRADYLSTYGAPAGATPAFDALASEGTRFDLAIATASVTPVSHASILTGLFNEEHGLRVLAGHGGFRLPADVPTLTTILKDAGYATSAFHSAFPVSAHFGFDKGFDAFESFTATAKTANEKTWDLTTLQRRSDATTDLAIAHLTRIEKPFFTWIHYWDPHDPARIPPREFLPDDLPQQDGFVLPSRALYAAEVRYVDHEFGRLVDALKQSGQWENTLVVIVADHGEGLGDHGWDYHRILYQEQIRVPLIVRAPRVQQTHAVADLVSTVDIAPTVLDYLGRAAPRPMSGKSLRPLMEGRGDAPRVAFADQINGYDLNAKMLEKRPLDDFLYCAMDRDWKLVYRPANPAASELYHIADDPAETKNVFTRDHAQAQRLLGLLARRKAWMTAPPAPIANAGNVSAAQQALAGLGYVGGEAPAEQLWNWTCPAHAEEVRATRELCRVCQSPPVLVAAPR